MIRKYPKHFYEPIRIRIAAEQMQHDLRKLLPDLNESQWKEIDRNIYGWFEGLPYELEPVHDFWNFFGSFSRGLKLKSLINWITAENIIWQEENVPVKNIFITWDFPGLEFMGKAPYKAEEVSKKIYDKTAQNIQKELEKDSQERSEKYPPRDHYRIILFDDQKGGAISDSPGFYILEGNRRVVRAITKNLETISAYVGRFTDKQDLWPENYWIHTGLLRDLIFLAIYYEKEKDQKGFDVVRKFYQLLLRDFDVARIATIDKSFKNYERSDKLRDELIQEDLK